MLLRRDEPRVASHLADDDSQSESNWKGQVDWGLQGGHRLFACSSPIVEVFLTISAAVWHILRHTKRTWGSRLRLKGWRLRRSGSRKERRVARCTYLRLILLATLWQCISSLERAADRERRRCGRSRTIAARTFRQHPEVNENSAELHQRLLAWFSLLVTKYPQHDRSAW